MMQTNVAHFITQFKHTLTIYKGSVLYVKKHRPWEGFWDYGWVSRFLIFAGMIVGLKFLSIFVKWINKASQTETTQVMSMATGMFADLYNEGFKNLFSGNLHFVMLVLLEVIIFHVCRRTIEQLRGEKYEAPTLKDFVRAQVRMFKVSLLAMIAGKVIGALLGIPFGILGFNEILSPVVKKMVEFFFVGFAVVDNYNEQFGLNIKESLRYSFNYLGVVLAIGLVLYILMAIPVIGPIAGPILASVTATLAMYELSDLHRKVTIAPDLNSETV